MYKSKGNDRNYSDENYNLNGTKNSQIRIRIEVKRSKSPQTQSLESSIS